MLTPGITIRGNEMQDHHPYSTARARADCDKREDRLRLAGTQPQRLPWLGHGRKAGTGARGRKFSSATQSDMRSGL